MSEVVKNHVRPIALTMNTTPEELCLKRKCVIHCVGKKNLPRLAFVDNRSSRYSCARLRGIALRSSRSARWTRRYFTGEHMRRTFANKSWMPSPFQVQCCCWCLRCLRSSFMQLGRYNRRLSLACYGFLRFLQFVCKNTHLCGYHLLGCFFGTNKLSFHPIELTDQPSHLLEPICIVRLGLYKWGKYIRTLSELVHYSTLQMELQNNYGRN